MFSFLFDVPRVWHVIALIISYDLGKYVGQWLGS